jgi:hypothetical protein
MLFPIGSTATRRDQAWQVTGVRAHTRELTSLDGQRVIYAAVDRLTEAP